MLKERKKVFVGMSGGVDSSVATYLLKKQGCDVTGVFMRCFNVDGCAERDAEDARRVAEKLEIPFYVWDFEKEYKEKVVEYMIDGYKNGITPNPDVECNREIKFGLFLKRALKFGADYVATGHYVRLGTSQFLRRRISLRLRGLGYRGNKKLNPSGYTLMVARDKNKDQSYFLWTLTQKQLRHCLFPIGDYLKSEVREIAKKIGLSTAEKKDSQGICFLGNISLSDFLAEYLPKKNGVVLNTKGEKIGEHKGAYFYTIGQRQGVGEVKHQKGNKIHKPIYVVEKDVKSNTVVMAEEGSTELTKEKILLKNINLIGDVDLKEDETVMTRIRYRQPLVKAEISTFARVLRRDESTFARVLRRDEEKLVLELEFEKPQKFVAKGQSAVFYSKKGEVLGGGVISDSQ